VALVSLLKTGAEVRRGDIERLAADPRTRMEFFTELTSLGRQDLFPEAYRSQAKLAESDMVRWLCSPSEMCEQPKVIEQLDTRVLTTGVRRKRYYLFRFYYDYSDKLPHMPNGWLVGLSGPWPADQDELRYADQRLDTFSVFSQADERGVDAHYETLFDSLKECLVDVRRIPPRPYRDDA
jgi:hypothetical protein